MDLADLLEKLYAERRFLQLMIEALEISARSPSRQLMQSLSALAELEALPPRKRTELERLARRILEREEGRSRRRRGLEPVRTEHL